MGVKNSALLSFFLLYWTLPSLPAEKHSLYYIYTCLSKPVNLPGIYHFTAMGLLDNRQIDYYNSKDQRKIPKQLWMKEKMKEDYWEKGTQSRKSKEQWFHVNIDILIKRMRQNESDLHVLQWRHGCEIEQQGSEEKFSKGISEYGYDGEDFIYFDIKESQWVASVFTALPTKRKWDNVPILNQYTKGYLEKECVYWLNKFREYADDELRNGSPPDVHVFAKRSTIDKTKLKLTCMATGFYPRDVTLFIRKHSTSLPEDVIESTGIRPNHDETFQIKKSVEIQEDEKANYVCFVVHKTLKEPNIITWDEKCIDCQPFYYFMIGIVIGGLPLTGLVVYILMKKRKIAGQDSSLVHSVELLNLYQHAGQNYIGRRDSGSAQDSYCGRDSDCETESESEEVPDEWIQILQENNDAKRNMAENQDMEHVGEENTHRQANECDSREGVEQLFHKKNSDADPEDVVEVPEIHCPHPSVPH